MSDPTSAAVQTVARRPARRIVSERLILGVAFTILVIAVWEAVTRLGIVRPIFLASFSNVMIELWEGITEGWLWPHVGATALVWVIGYVLGAIAGIAFGILAGASRRASYVADPWLNAVYVMPDIALVPIFIIWFGIGLEFKVWFVFLSGFFFVAVNTLSGVRATEGRYVTVARSFGARRMKVLRTVILPGSVPYVITGLRQAAGRSLVGVVAAEFVASNQGIGFMTSVAGQTFNTPRVMVGIVILALTGVIVTEILGRIEHRFDAWRA
jgi:ABC-type nitrate/sulfonate/bicarbonate transport system permease component